MLLIEQEIDIPIWNGSPIGIEDKSGSLLAYFEQAIRDHLGANGIPVRFAVTQSSPEGYHCELGILTGLDDGHVSEPSSIFEFSQREVENSDKFNAVMIIPTGVGAEIGGHAGDAGPVARLLAGACDTLITHPNVINASALTNPRNA